jgi:hypothetical protein
MRRATGRSCREIHDQRFHGRFIRIRNGAIGLDQAHPDWQVAKLTNDSNEQAQAGLRALTAEKFARCTHLNEL